MPMTWIPNNASVWHSHTPRTARSALNAGKLSCKLASFTIGSWLTGLHTNPERSTTVSLTSLWHLMIRPSFLWDKECERLNVAPHPSHNAGMFNRGFLYLVANAFLNSRAERLKWLFCNGGTVSQAEICYWLALETALWRVMLDQPKIEFNSSSRKIFFFFKMSALTSNNLLVWVSISNSSSVCLW